MDESLIVTKMFALKAQISDAGHGSISGAAAVMGNLDRGGDVLAPGCFDEALEAFRQSGFVADTHNWSIEGMCAMPKVAEVRGNQLYSEAEFHSDPDAQVIRTRCQERIANGLSIGLSVGFRVGERTWFDDGAAMVEHLKGLNVDLTHYDIQAIEACKYGCRLITKVAELFEWSICPVPMNPKATVANVKSVSGDAGALDGLKFAAHIEAVLGAVDVLVSRAESIKAQRETKGAKVSPDSMARLKALGDRLSALSSEEEQPEAPTDDARLARLKALSLKTLASRTAGLPG